MSDKKFIGRTLPKATRQAKSQWIAACAITLFASGITTSALQAQTLKVTADQVRQWMKEPAHTTRGLNDKAMGLTPASSTSVRSAVKFRIAPVARGERPSELLLTEFLPPVANQGHQGSCVAWASAYYVYTYQVAQNRKRSPEDMAQAKYQFSPAFIYNLGPHSPDERGGGMQICDAMRNLREWGATTLDNMPYDDKDSSSRPGEDTLTKAARYHARDYALLFQGALRTKQPIDVEPLKTYLAETRLPFVMGIPAFQDFAELSHCGPDYVYSAQSSSHDSYLGLHAVTVIGYDDAKKAFRIVNSWSPSWGDKGFMWISEDFVSKLSLEGWGLVAGGAIVRDANAPEGPIKAPVRLSQHVSAIPGSALQAR